MWDLSDSTALMVLAVFLAWTTLYFILCLCDPRRSYEWHCRVVTLIHACIIVSLSGWSCFIKGPWPFTHPGGSNDRLQHWTVVICMGYFIFDFLWCLCHQTEGYFMHFHHLLSIFGTTMVLYRGRHGPEMMATIFGTEMTNPLLQTRWFLRTTGKHKTFLGELVDISFMLLFGYLRIGVASYLVYCYLNHPKPDLLAKAGGTGMYLVGWVFWVMIVKYGVRKYYRMFIEWKKSQRNESHIETYAKGGKGLQLNGVVSNGKEKTS